MAGRCGCATACNCDERGEYGISMRGAGTANNPRIHRFDPRVGNIIGPGLFWNENDKELSTLVSGDPGNTITIGSDKGLYAAGGGETPGPDTGAATVANLPATNIVGGLMGAGFLHTPENFRRSFERAVTLGLDMVHVPVRTLRDGVPVASTDPTVQRVTDGTLTYGASEVDTQRWSLTVQPATRYTTGSFNNTTGLSAFLNPSLGFFGFTEEPQYGGTFCSDIARLIGGRIVIMWQVFDERSSSGLRDIISRYRIQASSIVVASDLALLDPFRAMGIATGAFISNIGQLTSLSPQNITASGAAWAVISMTDPPGFTDDQIRAYPQAGINTLAYPAMYQSEHARINTAIADGGLGLRGGLSPDPVYYNGPANNYVYRHNTSTWDLNTVEYGHYNDARWPSNRTRSAPRGYTLKDHNSMFLYRTDGSWRGEPGHELDGGHSVTGPWWILQGWMCPIPVNEDGSWTFGWWSRWREVNWGSVQNFVCVAFGIQYDQQLRTGLTGAGFQRINGGGYVAKFEHGTGTNHCYFEDWGDNVLNASTRFSLPHTVPRNNDLNINALDGDLEQNKVEGCYGVQVNAATGTITLLQGTVDRTTGRLTGHTVAYQHTELLHTGRYIYLAKCGESNWTDGEYALSLSFRRATVQPGVLTLRQLFPWAT